MGAAEEGLRSILDVGDQSAVIDRMQTRAELYELLDYEGYNAFDSSIFNFTLTGNEEDPHG
jgi:methylisocitrate lyase